MSLSDTQVWNLLAGLLVVVVLFGGIGVYGLMHGSSRDSEKHPDPRARH